MEEKPVRHAPSTTLSGVPLSADRYTLRSYRYARREVIGMHAVRL